MTTQPPPPRYRVVEQGRRLVVIDTATGKPAGQPVVDASRDAVPTLPGAPVRSDFGGRSTLVTHPLYDDRAPRTLELDEAATRTVGMVRVGALVLAVALLVGIVFAPWLIVVPIVLAGTKTRAFLRGQVTAWLDRFDAGRSQ